MEAKTRAGQAEQLTPRRSLSGETRQVTRRTRPRRPVNATEEPTNGLRSIAQPGPPPTAGDPRPGSA